MHIAWFRPAPVHIPSVDDVAVLLEHTRTRDAVEIFDEARAHDFVWMHFRRPFELAVYELDDTPAHQYIWPYLLRYPGLLIVRSLQLHHSRAAALRAWRRPDHFAAELSFSGWSLLRAPLVASRGVVVAHAPATDEIRALHPAARVHHVPTAAAPQVTRVPRTSDEPTLFGLVDRGVQERTALARRALDRTRALGVRADLLVDADAEKVLARADVLIEARWPSAGVPLPAAIAAMALAIPPVVMETAETADWPALDPQTWQARGFPPHAEPICVSLDPRDEEHSLMLTMRRLSGDAALRDRLGRAARAWWETHATPGHAAAAFDAALDAAASAPPPAHPADWPAHLSADGTERAKEILAEFGMKLDW